MKVYLAGPIAGCNDEEAHGWRETMKSSYPSIEFLDPMVRDYRENTSDDELTVAIVEGDKADIDEADLVFANFWRVGVGTSMEILYAFDEGIPCVVVVPNLETCSPWILYHATHVFQTMSEALEFLEIHVGAFGDTV